MLVTTMNNTVTKFQEDIREEVAEVKRNTQELVQIYQAMKGLATVLMWIGKLAKPIAFIATAITAATLYLQGVKIPKT